MHCLWRQCSVCWWLIVHESSCVCLWGLWFGNLRRLWSIRLQPMVYIMISMQQLCSIMSRQNTQNLYLQPIVVTKAELMSPLGNWLMHYGKESWDNTTMRMLSGGTWELLRSEALSPWEHRYRRSSNASQNAWKRHDKFLQHGYLLLNIDLATSKHGSQQKIWDAVSGRMVTRQNIVLKILCLDMIPAWYSQQDIVYLSSFWTHAGHDFL